MKKWIRIVLIALMLTLGIVPLSHASNPISRDGYYHGIFLGGKVKVVNYEIPSDLAYRIVSIRDTDTYDRYLEPDQQTLDARF